MKNQTEYKTTPPPPRDRREMMLGDPQKEPQSPGSLHPVVRRGWRHFHCYACEHRWKWPSRDALSPSGENCPRCGEWCHPYNSERDAAPKCWCANCKHNVTFSVNGIGMWICDLCRMDITPNAPGERPGATTKKETNAN